ncbi:MAG: metallophosphoesterase [Chloroflexi bacterium]|nr:metallophosphoesterase [Chloroflexota bacterium]
MVLAHTSDVHLDSASYLDAHRGLCSLEVLRQVIEAANTARADVLLSAGDLFEHNRLPTAFVNEAVALLAEAGCGVVILPGNHDPLTADSVYLRGGWDAVSNVHVLGADGGESIVLPALDLEIWGRAHRDYGDMIPLGGPPPRRTRWQVAIAHGHFTPVPDYSARFRPSWLFGHADLRRTGADYVALGHWDRTARVSVDGVPAFYSGSPRLTHAVNVVQLNDPGPARVTRQSLSSAVASLP